MRSLLLALAMTWPLLAAAESSVELPAAAASSAPSLSAPAEQGFGMEAAAEGPAADADVQALEVISTSHGQASFYAKRFHGRRTASGEPHDALALTAAHRSLPFGTWVRVQSLLTGRTVNVRINDRGPFTRGRIIDLSRAAADALGMLHSGTHGVKVQVLALPRPSSGN